MAPQDDSGETPLDDDVPVYAPAEGEDDEALLEDEARPGDVDGDGVPKTLTEGMSPSDAVDGDPPGGSAANTPGADPGT